ncbi:MAG: hypothetical protein HIU82_04270 [Proteobacteria bacterium]|nr:hypothetical protein [Pseudomonadota bacterium]
MLTQAVAAVGLDHAKLAEHIHAATFKTMVGDIKFGADGEWAHERMLQSQFQGVSGNAVQQFMDPAREVVLSPAEYKTGALVTPFGAA